LITLGSPETTVRRCVEPRLLPTGRVFRPDPSPLLIPQRRRVHRQIEQRDVVRQCVVQDGRHDVGRQRRQATLSWPFLAPTSLPETGPKSAKTPTQPLTDQRVTRGRIKRLDCSPHPWGSPLRGRLRRPNSLLANLCSIGWRRKRCGCVSSVVIEHYRHIATRKYVPGWWPKQETPCQDNVRTTTIRASKISPEGHHEHPESFQDRTH